ncbi:hypothetical protein F5Y16DRAFT_399526 [Xylariaceae sp. FL0255]|nr:hypothetical protein F5Y16DRAFT_399526 [Xylariaceae sp. FL0255]
MEWQHFSEFFEPVDIPDGDKPPLSFPIVTRCFWDMSLSTAAWGLPSRVVTSNGKEILLENQTCGISYNSSPTDAAHSNERPDNALKYAQQCYQETTNSSGSLNCDNLISKSLPAAVLNPNAE